MGTRISLFYWLLATAPLAPQAAQAPDAEDRPLSLDGYEELWRIGGAEAEGWDAFGSVREVGFGPDGGLVVHDRRGVRVVVVGPDGELVRELAGSGAGPGEFQLVMGVLVRRDGGFAVYDGAKRAFMRYGPAGEHQETVRVGWSDTEALNPVLVPSDRLGEVFRMMPTDSGGSREIRRLTFEEGNLTAETFFRAWRSVEQELLDGKNRFSFNFRDGEASITEAFFPPLRVDRLPGGGLAVVDSSAYEVKLVDATGRVSGAMRRQVEPVPVTDRMRRAEQERRREAARRTVASVPRAFEALLSAIDDMKFYPEISVITELRTGWAGEVWVHRHGRDPLRAEGPIDVLSPTGAYVGTFPEDALPMPVALGPDGRAAFIETDELGAASVVVARLPIAVAGF